MALKDGGGGVVDELIDRLLAAADEPDDWDVRGLLRDAAAALRDQNRQRTLRDWFAGMALMGLARSYAEGTVDDYMPPYVAEDCYKLADALLRQREKEA